MESKACLVGDFENYYEKQFLRRIFGVLINKICIWELNYEK